MASAMVDDAAPTTVEDPTEDGEKTLYGTMVRHSSLKNR